MKGKFLLFFYLISIGSVLGQAPKISGTVTDATDQQPLIGVSVSVQGSNTATQTDVDGKFTINAAPDGVLIFSYLGYLNKEVPVNQQTQINVSLSKGQQELEQVVVIGYGTQRKRDLTGSITSVKGEDIAKSPNINPISSLQGKVAGLTIVNSGTPGTGPTIRLRGLNSTNASNPIYVVDGVIQTNVDYLNSDDIESIEVLKDPSSTAIFGVQGGNGVIVVTTKRAEKGKTRVAFQSTIGLQSLPNKIAVTNGPEFTRLYKMQLANINGNPFDFTNYTANTDWQDLVFRDASINTNNISISNSGEKSTTLINAGYSNQEGILRGSGFKKYTFRLNEEIRINKNIKVGGDINAFHYDANPPEISFNSAIRLAPIMPVKTNDGYYYDVPSFQNPQIANIINTIERNDKTSIAKGYRATGQLFAEVTFLKRFKWKSAVYTDISHTGGRNYTPLPFKEIVLGEGNRATDTTYNETIKTSVAQNQNEYRRFQQDHTLTFDSTFNEKHKVTALAGFTTIYDNSTTLNANRRDTTLNIPNDPDYWYIGIVNNSNPAATAGGGGSESSQISYFGRVNYAFADKYLLNASIRRDGISKFAPQNRWGTFGSVGLGWVMSEESFFKDNIAFIDFLKLKASWGTLGNANGFGENLYRPGLNTGATAVFGDNLYTAVQPAYIPDPNLHWEVVHGLDFGLEFTAFDSRLNTDIAVYSRTTKDIITNITVPNQTLPFRTNLGNISNKGVEVALTWRDKLGEDFTYSLSPNFSYNKNKVVSIGDGIDFLLIGNGGVNRTTSGEPIGYFYGYRQIGIYQTLEDIENMPTNTDGTSMPGDIAYQDINNDGEISDADRTNLGSYMPDWNYGFNISLGYKNFDLLVEGNGVAGNYIYTERRNARFAVLNYESNRINAWNGPGTTNVEPILDDTRLNNYLFSTYFLEPGDYFRLRTLQLGYTFKPELIKKVGLSKLRLYVSGQNIKTWSKTTGYSPEVPITSILGGGADNGFYPQPTIYTAGINLTF